MCLGSRWICSWVRRRRRRFRRSTSSCRFNMWVFNDFFRPSKKFFSKFDQLENWFWHFYFIKKLILESEKMLKFWNFQKKVFFWKLMVKIVSTIFFAISKNFQKIWWTTKINLTSLFYQVLFQSQKKFWNSEISK